MYTVAAVALDTAAQVTIQFVLGATGEYMAPPTTEPV